MKSNLRIPKKLAALAVVSSVALTATTATSVAKTEKASADSVSLVAYSTPQAAYAQLIPAFQATPAGKGVDLHPVATAPRATRAARSRPASRPTSSTSRSRPT